MTGTGEGIGSGWGGFTALVAPGDFSGDGKPDIVARRSDGALLLYRGDGDSGFAGAPEPVGSGWQTFTALLGPGDWNGDGKVDVLARAAEASSCSTAATARPAGSRGGQSRSAPAGAASPR